MLRDLDAADEITAQVERLLRKADAYGRLPTPVDDIVSAAKLATADDYLFDDAKIAKAPADIRHLLRSAREKILGVVDRRERVVHVSPTIDNDGRRRFVLLHETSHPMLPHQQHLVYADDGERLSAATKRLFEREANQGAAELLFQRGRFAKDAADLETSMAAIWLLAERYGASRHAAARRYAESHKHAVAVVVLSSKPCRTTPPGWRREEVCASSAWIARMGQPRWPRIVHAQNHPWLAALLQPGLQTVVLSTPDGEPINVQVEAANNTYKNFVLLSLPQRRLLRPRRVRIGDPAVSLI